MSRGCMVLLLFALGGCDSSPGPCKNDFDCNGTLVCRLSTGECEAVVCRTDSDCVASDLTCVDNACVPRHCETDDDCGRKDYGCLETACVPRQFM